MAKKKQFLEGIAAFALVFALGFTACDNGTTPENETKKAAEEKPREQEGRTQDGQGIQETRVYQAAGLYVNDASEPLSEVSGLLNALGWIKDYAEEAGSYTIVLDTGETVPAQTLSSAAVNNKRNVTITLLGLGVERIIQLSGTGRLFSIGSLCSLTFILGNNITLKGVNNNTGGPLVFVTNGDKLEMLDGSKITGNTNIQSGSGSGGGVYVMSTSFTMKGGEISGNTARVSISGGVTAASGGGGIYVSSSGVFKKTGGVIYGYTEGDSKSNKVIKLADGALYNEKGHAVYGYYSTRLYRETTADETVNLDTTKRNSDGGWDTVIN